MPPKPSRIALAPYKRLRPVLGPVRLVVERRRVPDNLHVDLRQQHREAVGTHPAILDLCVRRCDVAAVVLRVEVLAVPALREADVDHDARRARLLGHGAIAHRPALDRREARVRPGAVYGAFPGRARHGVADEHAEAGLEGGHGAAIVGVRVIDGDAAGAVLEADVGDLVDAVVAAVAGVEKERGRPVVGEVLGEGAGAAGGLRGDVREFEIIVQAVATVELVEVASCRCYLAGKDEAVSGRKLSNVSGPYLFLYVVVGLLTGRTRRMRAESTQSGFCQRS